MPPIVLVAAVLSALFAADARAAPWRWPLEHRHVARHFNFDPARPFARGGWRGVTLDGTPGATVRAACGGRVTFAGRLPGAGVGVTIRCGHWAATELGLGRAAVGRGALVAPGQRLGALGAAGALRVGARRDARADGYVDPLALFGDGDGDGAGRGPEVAPAPRDGRRVPPPPRFTVAERRRLSRTPGSSTPLASPLLLGAIWVGLGLLSASLTAGIALRTRDRRPRVSPRGVVAEGTEGE